MQFVLCNYIYYTVFWFVCFSFHCKISFQHSFLNQDNLHQYFCRFYSNLLSDIIESQLMASKVLFESLQLKNDAIFSIKICYRCNQVSSYVCWCDNGCGVSSLTYNIRNFFTISCMTIQIIILKNNFKYNMLIIKLPVGLRFQSL